MRVPTHLAEEDILLVNERRDVIVELAHDHVGVLVEPLGGLRIGLSRENKG